MGTTWHGDSGVAISGASRPGSRQGAGLAVREIEQVSERSGSSRILEVRLTYYLWTGHRMFNGEWPRLGMAAVDPRVIPLGTRFRVVGDDVVRIAGDTGGGVLGSWVDVYFESDAEGRAFIAKYGEYVEVEIVQGVEP